jgi:[pyruvate, water dikinase]-phosphate phosphotransferase / [pyruvate, water dikinase] kinase
MKLKPSEIKKLTIFTLSDSSGETAEAVARACLVQFPADYLKIHRLPQVISNEQITEIVKEIKDKGIIAYTLVLPEYRENLEKQAKKYQIFTIDLLGPLLSSLTELTGQTPLREPGRLHLLDEEYFKRMAAIDFSIRFDDGKQPESLSEADIVLIGVSRTSKTPNCMYLAQQYGLRSANIPIVPHIPLPSALFQINPKKIIGLDIDPTLLQNIRNNRAQMLHLSRQSDYSDPMKVQEEIEYAHQIFRQLKCKTLNVSNKAVEEISSEIIRHLSSS